MILDKQKYNSHSTQSLYNLAKEVFGDEMRDFIQEEKEAYEEELKKIYKPVGRIIEGAEKMEHKYIDADVLKDIIGKMIPNNNDGEITPEEFAASEMAADIAMEIDEMPAADVEPVRKWISCSERLPDFGEECLIVVKIKTDDKDDKNYPYKLRIDIDFRDEDENDWYYGGILHHLMVLLFLLLIGCHYQGCQKYKEIKMILQIEIPHEFESDFIEDRFKDSLMRLILDTHLMAGKYEKETATMLIEAFRDGKIIHNKITESNKATKEFTHEEIEAIEDTICKHMITAKNCVDCIKLIGMIADMRTMRYVMELLLKEVMWADDSRTFDFLTEINKVLSND